MAKRQRTAIPRVPIVGVIGSADEDVDGGGEKIGALLAMLGVHLITGGGPGAMRGASKGFFEQKKRKGLVIGVVPCSADGGKILPTQPKEKYPNEFVEVPIYTHLHLSAKDGTKVLSRNHIVVLTAQVIVVLPGKTGTASEVQLAKKYNRPVVGYQKDTNKKPRVPLPKKDVKTRPADVRKFVLRELGRLGPEYVKISPPSSASAVKRPKR